MPRECLRGAVAVLALAGVLAWGEGAWAAGIQLFDQGPSGQGEAYAGAGAVAEDASTVFFNPAGMTELNGYQTAGGLQIIAPSGTFRPSVARTAPLAGTGAASVPLTGPGNRDFGETVVVPNAYLVAPLTDDLRAGFGLGVPFGLVTDYGNNSWIGRYYAERTALTTVNANPSLAYKVADWLSLGAGADVMHADAQLTNAVDFGSICTNAAGAGACSLFGLAPQANDGQVSLTASDTTASWNMGAMLQPLEHTRIGLAYRSSYNLHLGGTAVFATPAAYRTLQAAIPAFGGNFTTTGARANITLPATASLSLDQGLSERWTLLADVSWTQWSSFKNLIVTFSNPLQPAEVIPENWHDTLRESLGLIYAPNDKSKLRLGVAYDPTPTKAATRTFLVPDDTRIWLSVGYNLQLMEHLSLDAAYTHLFIPGGSKVSLSNANQGAITGTFSSAVNVFALGLKYQF